jgi:O-antigen/teichoic acid export membrane protein
MILFGIAYNLFFSIDVFFLEHFRGLDEVGQYTIARNMTNLLIIVPDAITTVLMPTVAGLGGKSGVAHLKSALLLTVVASILFASFFFIFGDTLVSVIFTHKYSKSLDALYILSIGMCFYSVNFILGEYLVGVGKPGIYSKSQIMAFIIALISDFYLVPLYGIFGAGLGFTLGCLAGLILLGLAVLKHEKNKIG